MGGGGVNMPEPQIVQAPEPATEADVKKRATEARRKVMAQDKEYGSDTLLTSPKGVTEMVPVNQVGLTGRNTLLGGR